MSPRMPLSRPSRAALAGAILLSAAYARLERAESASPDAQAPYFLPLKATARRSALEEHLTCRYGDQSYRRLRGLPVSCDPRYEDPRSVRGFAQRATGRDDALLCHQLVFRDMEGEPRCTQRECAEKQRFALGFEEFLRGRGYEFVVTPRNGDVAVYFFTSPDPGKDLGVPTHFGRYARGQVLSKLGEGATYLHDIGMVRPFYGDGVAFMRKTARE